LQSAGAGLHDVVGAHARGHLQGLVRDVDGDDLGSARGPQALHADVAEPADADDGAAGARGQERRRLLDRPIGGQPGVGVGGDVLGGKTLLELEGRALHGAQVLRESAVDVEAGELGVLAVHVLAPPAGGTDAVGLQRVHDHGVARPQGRDRRSYLLDPPGVLVPERVGQRWVLDAAPDAFHHVQVRAADAGSADADDHVVGSLDAGVGNLVQTQPLVTVFM
jgi:hypothetical protein